jgi:hypothetical protein
MICGVFEYNKSFYESVERYLNSCETGRASRIDAIARSGKLEEIVDTPGTKSTASTWDKVGTNLLGRVNFTIIIAGLAIEGPDALETSSCSAVCYHFISMMNHC